MKLISCTYKAFKEASSQKYSYFFKEIFLNIFYTEARGNFTLKLYLSSMLHRLN